MLASAQHIPLDNQPFSTDSHTSVEAAHARPDSQAQSSGERPDSHASSAAAARPDVVVLDVRNDYEWDAGHFQGANRPQEVGFEVRFGGHSLSFPDSCVLHLATYGA